MIKLSISEILKATNGILLNGKEDIHIESISIDSRNISIGDLFIPIIGETFDGHSFIGNAFNNGAIGTLTENDIDHSLHDDKIIIKVLNTTEALQKISQLVLQKSDMPVVAVTGSTGKTSTKDLIYSVLSQQYNVHKNEGNFNNHIGLPLTLLNINNNHEIVILEMGMSGKGEIAKLSEIAKPSIGIITNIGVSHIEKLGSQENIFEAKMEISSYMDEKCSLLINGDDIYLRQLRNENTKFQKIFVGFNKENDIFVNKLECKNNFTNFQISFNNEIYEFTLNVPGEHNVLNALLAISVGINLNIPIEKIQQGISNYKGSNMRLNIVDGIKNSIILNDCYNASPDSMLAALKVLEKTNCKRRIAVLGDMLEMGIYSEDAHKNVGHMVKKYNVNILLTVGGDSLFIQEGAREEGFDKDNLYHFNNNKEASLLLNKIINEKDAILIKGSRGMKMEEIVQSLQERS